MVLRELSGAHPGRGWKRLSQVRLPVSRAAPPQPAGLGSAPASPVLPGQGAALRAQHGALFSMWWHPSARGPNPSCGRSQCQARARGSRDRVLPNTSQKSSDVLQNTARVGPGPPGSTPGPDLLCPQLAGGAQPSLSHGVGLEDMMTRWAVLRPPRMTG